VYSTDARWYKHWIETLTRDYEGNLWTQSIAWPKETPPEAWGITVLKGCTQGIGLSTDPEVLHCGQNSGFAAVNLAYHRLNGEGGTIILLGFDMHVSNGKRHFFGAHPGNMEVDSNYNDFMRNFRKIDCAALGIDIWNCTRRTALDCFPLIDLDTL